jgi:hypothetical protein
MADTRQERLDRLSKCVEQGEDAYDQLYDPRTHRNPAGHYSDAKDFFGEAISIANELELHEQAAKLSERLTHIQAVYRSQFASLSQFPEPKPSAAQTLAADMEEALRLIQSNAALVINVCSSRADFDFGYNAQSVQWLDTFIEDVRNQPDSEPEREQFVANIGSFLGEAIIAEYGGRWALDDFGWHIRFDDRNRAYPFNKVAKQYVNGPEDSIFGFYNSIGTLGMSQSRQD